MKPIPMILSAISLLLATAACSENTQSISDKLKATQELSAFNDALEQTGVASELGNGKDHMVFAPISSQFSALVSDPAKCTANAACKKALAELVRNHIVDKVVNLRDEMKYKAGIFSINNHFIPLDNAGANRFTVEGNNIIETEKLVDGTLYTTDGVLVGDYERSLIQAYMQAAEPQVQKTSKSEKTTIPDPACGEAGCPDTAKTVTTITETITEVEP